MAVSSKFNDASSHVKTFKLDLCCIDLLLRDLIEAEVKLYGGLLT